MLGNNPHRLCHKVNSGSIAEDSQPAYHTDSFVTQVAMVPPWLPCVDIADVYFDEWNLHSEQSVSDGYTGVRESSRVNDDELAIAAGFLDTVDDGAFVIGLEGVKDDA